MGFGRRFRFGPPGENGDSEKPTAVETARNDLDKVTKDKGAKPEDVKNALTAYRDARDKARQQARKEYEDAQKDLRDVLTQRQEAILVGMSILE